MRAPRSIARDDSGFTLVELLVTCLLMVLVTGVILGIMVSTTNASASVRTTTSATSSGELATRTIDRGVTNAATPLQLSTPATGDLLLMARVASTTSPISWSCTAWYYSSADATIRTTSLATAIASPSLAGQRSWTLLVAGVRPIGTTPVIALSGSKVTVSYTVDAGKSAKVAFQTSMTSRTGVTGGTPCF